MNEAHLELLRSDGWRQLLEEFIVPFALGDLGWSDLGDDVVELGPGPGLTTDLLVREVGAVTALELDPLLAESLAQRLGERATVERGDATAAPFADDRFTAVVCFTMLHHVPSAAQQDRLFAEALRVLRPGGLLVANDSVASPELAALHEGDVYIPVDPAAVGDRLASVGFVDIDVRHNDFGWAAHARKAR